MAREFARKLYNSKEWEDVRGYVLRRDGYLCRQCGQPAKEVHHIVHLNPNNIMDVKINLNPDNLMSLCRDCHQKEHRYERYAGNQNRSKQSNVLPQYDFDENGQLIQVK